MKTLFITQHGIMDRPLRIYLCLAFGITWGVGGLGLLAGEIRAGRPSPLHPLHYVAAFGPSIAGVVMAASIGGWGGVRRMLAQLVPRRSSLPWYVAVLIGFPALNLAAARLLAPDFLAHFPAWPRLLYLLPLTLVADNRMAAAGIALRRAAASVSTSMRISRRSITELAEILRNGPMEHRKNGPPKADKQAQELKEVSGGHTQGSLL